MTVVWWCPADVGSNRRVLDGLHPYAKTGAIGFSERILELPFHIQLATQWILPPSPKRPEDFPTLDQLSILRLLACNPQVRGCPYRRMNSYRWFTLSCV